MDNFKNSVRTLVNVVTSPNTKIMPLSYQEQKMFCSAVEEVIKWLDENTEDKTKSVNKKSTEKLAKK